GVKFVYFNPEQSDAVPLPVDQRQADRVTNEASLDHETQKMWQEKQNRIEKLSAYRRRVIQCEKEFERSLARMRSVMTKIRNRPTAAVDEAKLLIEDIVEKLMCDDNVTLHLMNGKNEFEDIYFHSLNVAVISMMIGRAKGYSAAQLKELSFSALFHDIGKIKIPTAILRKQLPLTEPETNYLKLHTKYGVDLASQIEAFPEVARIVIAQHHEL
ncbi:HD domain-containing protein, partial [Vibrio parahaemolyticus]|nr:HD domain-containing protein [Vibrio parahaemolyticus]